MPGHSKSQVGPYEVHSYTDKKTGDTNIVTKGSNNPGKNPHTHEARGSSGNLKHADITNKDGSKTTRVVENKSFWLQDKK